MAFSKESLITNYEKQFDYSLMRNLVAYQQCYNSETQVVASHGTKNKFITTGTKDCMIAGVPVGALTAHTDYDPAAQVAYAAWVTATSYLATGAAGASATEVTRANENEGTDHYACILAHTSSAAGVVGNEPGVGADWRTYWRKMDQFAVDATGDSIAAGDTAYYLIVADSGGWLKAFLAMDSDGNLQIPAFDPTRYVALAIIEQDHSSGSVAWVFGTTAHDADSSSQTVTQILGSVYPDASLIK